MSTFYFILLILLVVWDIRQLWGQKKEIGIYLGLTALALIGGILVFFLPVSFGIAG